MPLGWLYAACNIGFLFLTLTLMPSLEWFFEAIGKDATLTGRIPLWNRILTVMLDNNTFTGFGYGMSWRDPRAVAPDTRGIFGQHLSGDHDQRGPQRAPGILAEQRPYRHRGSPGNPASLLGRAANLPENKYRFICLIMGYLMLNGFTERCLGSNYEYKTWILFVIMAIGCSRSGDPGR